MKIIKDNITNVVLFVGEDLTLDGHARGDAWEAKRVLEINTTLETVSNVPDHFVQGEWAYDSGWTRTAEGIAAQAARDAQALAEAKQAKELEMSAGYSADVYADIEYNTFTFSGDKESQNLLVAVLSAGSVPPSMYWRDISGASHSMTFSDLQGLSAAILTRGLVADTHFQTKLAEIQAATTQTELDLITW